MGVTLDYKYSKPINDQIYGQPNCQYWQPCWEFEYQTTYTESKFLGISQESNKGKGLVAESPSFVLCFGVCIALGDKDYNYADGTVTEEKQIGFGIGWGGSIGDIDAGFYFIIRSTWITNAGGTQYHQPGSAFSMSLMNLVEFQSATTVDLNND